MDEWKILEQKVINVENNGFIEISLKEPPNKNKRLIAISKGWINKNGKKLYKSNILFSNDVKNEIIEILKNIEDK